MAYDVDCSRWSGGWELAISGVGVTQSYTRDDAERMVRDYLATDGYDDWETAELRFHWPDD